MSNDDGAYVFGGEDRALRETLKAFVIFEKALSVRVELVNVANAIGFAQVLDLSYDSGLIPL